MWAGASRFRVEFPAASQSCLVSPRITSTMEDTEKCTESNEGLSVSKVDSEVDVYFYGL